MKISEAAVTEVKVTDRLNALALLAQHFDLLTSKINVHHTGTVGLLEEETLRHLSDEKLAESRGALGPAVSERGSAAVTFGGNKRRFGCSSATAATPGKSNRNTFAPFPDHLQAADRCKCVCAGGENGRCRQ